MPTDIDWIQTFSGKQFHFLAPKPEEIDINDIAHALSLTCRFTGHVKAFYSVAEHSFRGSFVVPKEQALAFLLHDGSEAYLADVSKPIKPHLTNYSSIEDGIMKAIAAKFGFTYPFDASIKAADLTMLFTEKRDLMAKQPAAWANSDTKPLLERIDPMPSNIAEQMFMKRYLQLTTK